ncbi:MAG TPA: methyltransferase domain-containing protein [Acidimicrobiales bacterium]|nr:methyltransferase domain-containing protein [Acidimicrobiales bacterium]
MTSTPVPYPLRNAEPAEAARLGSLQSLHDASTARHLERLGVGPGWDCVELGAGAGSVARWLLERVGDAGSVTAIDSDTALLTDLAARTNARVVQGDLTTLDFGSSCFDLAHSRSVLMHVPEADTVLEHLVPALRPGAAVLFEEVDGAPAVEAAAPGSGVDLPAPFRAVMLPWAVSWSWARRLPARLEALGFVDIEDDVREDLLRGASPAAAFWQQTLRTIRPVVTDAARMDALGRSGSIVEDGTYDDMVALLDDPDFEVPFSARHRVSARWPGGATAVTPGV